MTYKISLIPPNLRKNETIIQIADSLEHLSKIVNDIMMGIERKIDSYNNKLKDITNRVDIVDGKISQLKNVNKAVQVFSNSKYPSVDTHRTYVPIFPSGFNIPIPMVKHKVSNKYQLKNDEPLDKLHIYHVQVSHVQSENTEGLGKIPNDTNYLNDLLLYNSGKNLYKKFTLSDSFIKLNQPARIEDKVKIEIATAPVSIGDRNQISYFQQGESYFYSPDLGEVPSLDIPLDLPDLPGIADNVRYNDDENAFAISPSVVQSPTNNEDIVDLSGLPEIIPSPTPSPEPEIIEQIVKLNEPKVEPAPIERNIDEIVEKSNLPKIPDARASLMEAIREAGGSKKLKSVNIEENLTKTEKSGGDLMADLHAKLAMRRKGISGAQKQQNDLDSRGALTLMSALIPAPEETNDESSEQEEEWE